jgi:hypothetical protein
MQQLGPCSNLGFVHVFTEPAAVLGSQTDPVTLIPVIKESPNAFLLYQKCFKLYRSAWDFFS